jgi:hypothetical protein
MVMVNKEKAIYIKNGMEAKLHAGNAGEDGVNVQRAWSMIRIAEIPDIA